MPTTATHPTELLTVQVELSSNPELLSNIDGSDIRVRLNQSNGKDYSFLVDPALKIAEGDLVVCQVRNSFTFGIVLRVGGTCCSYDTYLENAVLEEGAHKLVLAKVDWEPVKLAIRAKRLYALEKRKAETRARLNSEAFNNVKEQL